MLLNARELLSQSNARRLILLTIEDVTERHAVEREVAELLRQKEMLLQEMQHRIANSPQIIASILLLKARTVQSEETLMHLRDAHQRVMSVAAVQQQLLASSHGDPVYIGPYLSRLSQALVASITDDSRPISLEVQAEGGTASCAEAVSIGLIVTESMRSSMRSSATRARAWLSLPMRRLKQAGDLRFPGIGAPEGQLDSDKPRAGVGTIVIAALAKQLDARVEVMRGRRGTTVSITHGTSDRGWLPLADAGLGLPPKSNDNSVAAA